jgi:hypothetical protein
MTYCKLVLTDEARTSHPYLPVTILVSGVPVKSRDEAPSTRSRFLNESLGSQLLITPAALRVV